VKHLLTVAATFACLLTVGARTCHAPSTHVHANSRPSVHAKAPRAVIAAWVNEVFEDVAEQELDEDPDDDARPHARDAWGAVERVVFHGVSLPRTLASTHGPLPAERRIATLVRSVLPARGPPVRG
jgi:hypothetical protein